MRQERLEVLRVIPRASGKIALSLGVQGAKRFQLPLRTAAIALEQQLFPEDAPRAAIFRKEGAYWTIAWEGKVTRLNDAKGLRYLAHLLRHPETAKRFMHAYIRAVRFYNDALKNGRLDGPTADDVIAILSEATPIKSREIYKLITPTGMNPDGRVNKESLAYDLAFYAEQGLVKGAVNLDDAVDGSFVEAALKELGPYRP